MSRFWWWFRFALEWVRSHTPFRPTNNIARLRPIGWAGSSLAQFFEMMWNNQIATYATLGNARRIQDIDALLHHFALNVSRVEGKGAVEVGLPLLLVIRAHAAYRSAASLAFSGAVMESMAVLRLSLETAGYAIMMQGDEDLSLIWTSRGDGEDAKRQARQSFQHSKVLANLRAKSEEIAGYYLGIYESLIDTGAHPNEFGFTTNMQLERLEDGGAVMTQVYLHDDRRVLEMVLKATAQVGVCVLKIFERMYPDQFNELGISPRIKVVASGI